MLSMAHRLCGLGTSFLIVILGSSCAHDMGTAPEPHAFFDVVGLLRDGAHPIVRGSRGIEDVILRLDSAAGGVGGLFADEDGALVVTLTPSGSGAAAREFLVNGIGAQRGPLMKRDGTLRAMRERHASYRFSELVAYHDAIIELLPAVDGMVSIDANERRNKVVIGVTDQQAATHVRNRIQELGLPQDAFAFTRVRSVREAASIRDHFRPTGGGMQIRVRHDVASNSWTTCTLGFNVYKHLEERYALTAGHCSGQNFGTNHFVSNPAEGSSSKRIGYVADLPSAYFCGGMLSVCRDVDVLRIRYYSSISSPGRVIHTIASGGPFAPGTLNRVSGQVWQMEEAPQTWAPADGDTVHKVGRTTGWTHGPIVTSCETWMVNYVMNVCQARVLAYADAGDSGAPVVLALDGKYYPVGIIWGTTDIFDPSSGWLRYALYTQTWRIDDEYGDLSFYLPESWL